MLKIFKTILICLLVCLSFAYNVHANNNNSVLEKLEKVDYKTVKGRFQLYKYYEIASKKLIKKIDTKLLEGVIKSYIQNFKYDSSHMTLEPFIPFYLKHKVTTVAVIKSLASKEQAADFYLRLEVAEREFIHGNG